jgi:Cu-processing system permease protein
MRERAATTLAMVGAIARLARYGMANVVRSRWLLYYTLFFLLTTDVLLRFSGLQSGVLLSLVNIVLLVIPLVALVFGTMYVYDAREFTQLLLAQPIGRRRIFLGLLLGLMLPLIAGFVIGIGVPLTLHGRWSAELRGTIGAMLAIGTALTVVFVAIALYIATRIQDKVRGLGAAIAVWLSAAVLYDGFVLLFATMFGDRSIEGPLLGLMFANPVDLGRVILLLQFDISALMGHTGAIFVRFFGGPPGLAAAAVALTLWAAVPSWLGARAFRRKDF